MSRADLSDIQRQFQAISERAIGVAERLGPDQMIARPRPGGWSVAECLTHLRITAIAYLPIWTQACHKAREARVNGSSEPFELDLLGRFFIWFLDPPPKIRFHPPGGFEPKLEAGGASHVLPDFLASQDEVLKVIAAAEGLPLDRIVIRSAFARHVRYSLWSSFSANAAHHRRHIWQAERVARILGR